MGALTEEQFSKNGAKSLGPFLPPSLSVHTRFQRRPPLPPPAPRDGSKAARWRPRDDRVWTWGRQ